MKNETENLVIDNLDDCSAIASTFIETYPNCIEEARAVMEKRCSYSDDWTCVVGIDSDRRNGIIIDRKTINDIYSCGNYLLGFDTDNYREFTILNPIFFKDIDIADLQLILPVFLTTVGEKYEVTTPSVVGFRIFSA